MSAAGAELHLEAMNVRVCVLRACFWMCARTPNKLCVWMQNVWIVSLHKFQYVCKNHFSHSSCRVLFPVVLGKQFNKAVSINLFNEMKAGVSFYSYIVGVL